MERKPYNLNEPKVSLVCVRSVQTYVYDPETFEEHLKIVKKGEVIKGIDFVDANELIWARKCAIHFDSMSEARKFADVLKRYIGSGTDRAGSMSSFARASAYLLDQTNKWILEN